MKSIHDFCQEFPVQMYINFCGGNRFMPEHELNRTQISPIFQKMRGKGMPRPPICVPEDMIPKE